MPKVLVVDDSLSVRKVVERALGARRIEVVCAASGGEAIDCIEREELDAVVCDVVIPDRDGYEICRFLKDDARRAATPVLLMSGVVNDDVRARAARAGSDGVLQKPFAAEELVRRLERLMSAPAAAGTAVPAPPVPPDPVPVAEFSPGPPSAPSADAAATILAQFSAIQGVQWAVLADRDGFVLEATAETGVEAEVAAALSACLAESSRGLGRELGRGGLQGMMLEFDKGMVAVYGVGAGGLLAIGMSEPSTLGKVRYYVRKAVSELSRVV